jgi:imidazolonepropionase-like amidohydrolase
MGTDLTPIAETSPGEIEQMVYAGMTEMEAIVSSTRRAAELCDRADRLGTIAPGKLADLVVVRKNPLSDIRNLRSIALVVKNGQVVDSAFGPVS